MIKKYRGVPFLLASLIKQSNNTSPEFKARMLYMVLDNLNNDPYIYQGKDGRKNGRAGNFYLCWIDNQKCLHHFKNGKFNQPYSSSRLSNLLKIVKRDPKHNWFLSPNTYRSKKIRDAQFLSNGKSNIRVITGFYLDFDVKKAGLSMAEFRNELPIILDRCHIVPNAIVNSGHGYHVYIILNQGNPVNSVKVFTHWQRVQKDMISAVKNECQRIYSKTVVDASVSDINRILRVAGSYNMKDPAHPLPVYVEYEDLDTSDRPSFKDLLHQWHDWYYSQLTLNQTKRDLTRKIHKQRKKMGHSTRTLNYNRCRDLFKEAGLKKAQKVASGYRDLILFYYETCALRPNAKGRSVYSDAETITNIKALNRSFYHPLKQSQVMSIIDEIPKIHAMIRLEQRKRKANIRYTTKYCPNNQTMINDIGISSSDQRKMLTIIGADEAKRRKPINYQRKLKKRKIQRKQARIKRNKKMAGMHAKGFTYKQIADKFHKSTKTVQRAIKSVTITGGHNTYPLDIQLGRSAKQASNISNIHNIYKYQYIKNNNKNAVSRNHLLDYIKNVVKASS